jgi:hypothetical protein
MDTPCPTDATPWERMGDTMSGVDARANLNSASADDGATHPNLRTGIKRIIKLFARWYDTRRVKGCFSSPD